MWRRIWALIIKEFFAIWNDKRSRAVIIVPPLIQLMVFGYAATFDVSHVATAIYNEDRGVAASKLVARFAGSPAFHVVYHLDAQRQIAQNEGRQKGDDDRHLPGHELAAGKR